MAVIKREFNTKISRARKRKNLTQREVAKFCGVSINAYQNWEREDSKAVPRHEARLKEILGDYDREIKE